MTTSLARRTAAAVAVARGATLLDSKMPDWWKKIDLGQLDLANGRQCVLGQLFAEPVQMPRWKSLGWDKLRVAVANGESRSHMTEKVCEANYDAGRIILGLGIEACQAYGFNASSHKGTTFGSLDAAWFRLIDDRQRADR